MKKNNTLSLVMLALLFFIMGLVSWVNSVLVPYFRVACDLHTQVQSYLVTFAFYIAYLVMTVPSGLFLGKVGLKKGGMAGLWLLGIGALLFIPAALTRSYAFFLVALFTMGTALAVLQTAANPFVTIIGPLESAARRISIMGICNKLAGVLSPVIFAAAVIRPQDQENMDLIKNGFLTGNAKEAVLDEMIKGVITPYLILGVALILFGIIFYKSSLPDINPNNENKAHEDGERGSILKYPYLVLGVLALFAHVGSQQISISTISSYAESLGYGMESAMLFPSYTLLCIMIGYLVGVISIPAWLSQQRALLLCTVTGFILSALVLLLPGKASIWSLVLLGIPNSLIYAGIWPLAIRNLGKWTSLGSSLLVMALCGNAVMSLMYGAECDRIGPHNAYWLLLPCFAYMIFYALYGYKIESWKKQQS